ncbi:crocetin glucosyltransferase, chloroplastic-like [Wolffia australiana]
MEEKQHFLIVSFPAQGHINPSLQLAKRLARLSARVTFSTSIEYNSRLNTSSSPPTLSFSPYSQGKYDKSFKLPDLDPSDLLTELASAGIKSLTAIANELAASGSPVTCVIFNFLVPWARDVAADLAVPAVLYWIQAAALFRVYHLFFNGHAEKIINIATQEKPTSEIALPGVPTLQVRDLPSLLLKKLTVDELFFPAVEATFQGLSRVVLVNTFDGLEKSTLTAAGEAELVAIGPALPSAYTDGEDEEDKAIGGDLQRAEDEYMAWLSAQKEGSVVYVSFGSHSVLPVSEREEISKALRESGRPYLWVARGEREGVEEGEKGRVVEWCSQVEVLASGAVGCFVTHCGWNSTLESVVCGVPMVGLPQWTDQMANCRLVEAEWGVGVRAEKAEKAELSRCIELVMGEGEGEDMRRRAKALASLARDAFREGGSSDRNLRAFVRSPMGGLT